MKDSIWEKDIHLRVKRVLEAMKAEQINVAIFLDALSWGTDECHEDKDIKYARTTLLSYYNLRSIIDRWWKPPRSPNSNKSRSQGARKVLEEFAQDCIIDIHARELHLVGQRILKVPTGDKEEPAVMNTDLSLVMREMKVLSPTLWNILYHAARSPKQLKRGIKRKPDMTISTAIAMLAYSRNQTYNLFQKSFGIFFKFRGLTIRGFDALHRVGLTASSTWALRFVKSVSTSAMNAAAHAAQNFRTILLHDNLELYTQAFSQRLGNQSHLDSGAAGTLIAHQSNQPLPPSVAPKLKAQREFGRQNPITAKQIFDREVEASRQLRPFVRHEILRVLMDSPDFDLASYPHRKDPAMDAPDGIRVLPVNKGCVTQQYILETQHVSAATIEGNDTILHEWFRQLRMASPADNKLMGLERIVHFVGDQLTIDRIRSIFRNRAGDYNSFDRMDYMQLNFGWFHLMLTYLSSLHDQYIGTSSGRGLQQAFDLLRRKGLNKVTTKGTFYHHMREAVIHVTTAHLRVCWMHAAGVKSLKELRTKSPQELLLLSDRILNEYASSAAINSIDKLPGDEQDHIKRQMLMWNRDAINFVILDRAIREGDVGIMEHMLPALLFRFLGGRNSKYTLEILELLQCLEIEYPDELKHAVTDFCWLGNFKGKRDTHVPLDMAQEHNIKDIKSTFRPDGPSNKWRQFREWGPAIAYLRRQNDSMEGFFSTRSRGRKHGIPSAEKDIKKLVDSYISSRVYDSIPKRAFEEVDTARDLVTDGFVNMQLGTTIKKWAERRNFKRRTDEEYDLFEGN
ncbi:hypothetical protein SCHPADRAFT_839364 [Schizopora paradoxa]|uniref:DUF6589 domain-containing protein n=1 Tax=Schizopora paradoxa TaxID=27342 RepID=A0A0H2RKX6_9AGAM|nr:hypothetical protein SCHPADRAFT_839364 [Schizopora paradoxa]